MKVAVCQWNQVWEDKEANKAKISLMLSNVNQELDLIVFPEMTLSGFSMNKDATELSESDLEFFKDIAKTKSCRVLFGGVQSGFNKLIAVNQEGEIISKYSKTHLYSLEDEDKFYSPGSIDQNESLFSIEDLNITPAICYDIRFPYIFWKQAQTTDVFIVIGAWPSSRQEHWLTLLRARAIENQAFVIGVNRTGSDPTFDYVGNSIVYDPFGVVVLDAGAKEGVFTTSIIEKQVIEKTRNRFHFLNDRIE